MTTENRIKINKLNDVNPVNSLVLYKSDVR